MEKIIKFLNKNKIEYYKQFDVSLISSIKIGGNLKLAIFPKTEKDLEKIVSYFSSQKIYFKVFGNLSNVLFVSDISYPIIITNKMIDEIEIKANYATVSAGVLLSKFCDQMRKNGLGGYEGLVGIPATVGGAIVNNAGAFGYSISKPLVKIKVFSAGKIFELKKDEIKFGYHYSNLSGFIVLSATFLFENKNEYDIIKLVNEYTYLRGKAQPNGLSLGSVFQKVNGKSAGFYIERAGLKGLRVGGIVISSKHANFFINEKGGSAIDFLRACTKVKLQVEEQFGVTLIPEIEKVGDKDETFGRLSYAYKK